MKNKTRNPVPKLSIFEKLSDDNQTYIDHVVGDRLINLIFAGEKIIATPEEIEGMREDVIIEMVDEVVIERNRGSQ